MQICPIRTKHLTHFDDDDPEDFLAQFKKMPAWLHACDFLTSENKLSVSSFASFSGVIVLVLKH